MMNRAFLASISVVVFSTALGACSGDDTDGTGGSDSGGTGAGGSGGGTSGGGSGAGTSGGGSSGSGGSGGGTSGGSGGGTSESLVGTPCEDDEDCPYDGGWCRTAYTNGYCTKDCTGIGQCDGAGTVCEITLGQCHKACTDATEAEDCRVAEGYSCVTRDGGSSCES